MVLMRGYVTLRRGESDENMHVVGHREEEVEYQGPSSISFSQLELSVRINAPES